MAWYGWLVTALDGVVGAAAFYIAVKAYRRGYRNGAAPPPH